MNDQEILADAKERYMGPCRPDEYPPHPPQFSLGSPYELHVQSSPMVLPPKDSFHSIEAYHFDIELHCTDPYFTESHGTDTVRFSGGTFPNGASAHRDGPIDDLSAMTFSLRGRTRWHMEDNHPENRGFVVGGRRYDGAWSKWSEWQKFEGGVAVGREPYSGTMFYWQVAMLTELVVIDGEPLQDIFHKISGEWREVMELEQRLVQLFRTNTGAPIERIVFTAKSGGRFYLEFAVPCDPGEATTLYCLADGYDPEYRANFDRVGDARFPTILAPAYDDAGNDLAVGASLTISQGDPEGLPPLDLDVVSADMSEDSFDPTLTEEKPQVNAQIIAKHRDASNRVASIKDSIAGLQTDLTNAESVRDDIAREIQASVGASEDANIGPVTLESMRKKRDELDELITYFESDI